MITTLFIFLAIIAASHSGIIERGLSLFPPFEDEAPHLMTWDLTGSAEFDGTYLRLTSDEEDEHGAVWNSYPCLSNNWEIQLHFHIHGKGVHLHGDGLAIWYIHEADILHGGPVFGSKDYFTGLGVFIDTFANQDESPTKHRHPYISAMVNNGSIHYEHNEDGTMTQIGGCHILARNLDVPTRVAVSYINNDLTVYVDNEGTAQWRICFKTVGVYLPTGYHFGISASTSNVTDNHDIIAMTALNMDPEDAEWEDKGDVIPKVENFEIPQKYHKEFIENEIKKILEKREAREEAEAANEDEREEVEEEIEDEDDKEESKATKIDDTRSTSLIRKLVYITGAIALILVSISAYKKYSERRRIRMEKRLY